MTSDVRAGAGERAGLAGSAPAPVACSIERGPYHCAFCDGYTARIRTLRRWGQWIGGAQLARTTWTRNMYCAIGTGRPATMSRLAEFGIQVESSRVIGIEGHAQALVLTRRRRIRCKGPCITEGEPAAVGPRRAPRLRLRTPRCGGDTERSKTSVSSLFVAGDARAEVAPSLSRPPAAPATFAID